MSIEGFPTVRRTVGSALAVAVLASPAFAAQVDFRPVLSFGLFHTGNVQIIGDDIIGDDGAAIAADLAVERTTESSTFSFLYQATYVGYRQNSALDFLGNLLEASYDKQVSRRTNVQATAGVHRTDAQGIAASSIDSQANAASNVDRPLTFVPRTTITRGYGSVSGSVGVGRRSLVDWAVRAGVNRFDEVPGVVFNDSTSAGARGGWRYELNERTTLGYAVDLDWFGYDVTDDSLAESVAFIGTHELVRDTTMTFALGATRTTTSGLSSNNATFLLAFARELTANSRLNAGVRQSVTPGTGLQAATNDSGAWISYAPSSPRNGLYGALDGAFWFRKTIPTDNTPTTETETLNLAGALGWSFSRFVSLSASCAYFYQIDRGDPSSSLNTRYAAYGLFLRWNIRGVADVPDAGTRLPQRR